MSSPSPIDRVVAAAAKQFAISAAELDDATGPEQIEGWDSLSHVGLVSAIEEEFGVSFDVEEVMEMETLGAIARLVEAKLAP